jgi:hypothetical protein
VDFIGYHSRAIETGKAIFGGPDALSEYTLDRLIEFLHALFYFLTGPGLVGMVLLSGVVGFWASYLFLRAFQVALAGEGDLRFLGVFLFLLPSIVFWASLLGKDSWVFFFLGLISYAFAHLMRRARPRYVLAIVVGVGVLVLIRPPVGAVMALALGVAGFVWFLARSARGPVAVLRPVLLAGSAFLVLGVTVTLVPRSIGVSVPVELDSVGEVASAAIRYSVLKHQAQALDPSTGSGSNVEMVFVESTPGGLLRVLPRAMFTAMFRPFIFEAHNVLAVGAALETTFLVGLLLWRRRNLRAAVKAVFAKPFLCFCVAAFFLLILIVSVEGNLGAIARHRTMALPFLLSLLAVSPRGKNHGPYAPGVSSSIHGTSP